MKLRFYENWQEEKGASKVLEARRKIRVGLPFLLEDDGPLYEGVLYELKNSANGLPIRKWKRKLHIGSGVNRDVLPGFTGLYVDSFLRVNNKEIY